MTVELKQIIERERVPYQDKEKLFLVLGLFLSGKISTGKAAELLGLRIDDFLILMHNLGIKYNFLDAGDAEEELDAYRKIFKNST